jgi:hypothetical protein
MNAKKIALSLLLAASSLAARAQEALPLDIARYVERRDLCDHFRGEEAYNAERREFLKQRMQEYCVGTDARLARLKRKYKRQSKVMSKLNEYEVKSEGRP